MVVFALSAATAAVSALYFASQQTRKKAGGKGRPRRPSVARAEAAVAAKVPLPNKCLAVLCDINNHLEALKKVWAAKEGHEGWVTCPSFAKAAVLIQEKALKRAKMDNAEDFKRGVLHHLESQPRIVEEYARHRRLLVPSIDLWSED